MPHHKPEGYNAASPYLVVSDARATIDFLERVLGGRLIRSFPNARGGVRHSEVRLDDTVVMVADEEPGWPAHRAHVHVYVPDVDAAYQRALAAGAESVQAPVRKDDEDRRGGVTDRGGTTWWIATRMA